MAATNRYFRSFVNTDVIGTEFGGVLKNLIAVAIGIVDGVGYGENTKASIITRGLVEMTDFAVAYGAKAETLSGLAGLGDLIATCESSLSRNNTAGRLLGQGYASHDVVKQMNQTAEGLASVAPILELAEARGVEMPIVRQVARCSPVRSIRTTSRRISPRIRTSRKVKGPRMTDKTRGRASVRRSLKRAFDQLRDGGGSAGGDRPRAATTSSRSASPATARSRFSRTTPRCFALNAETLPRSCRQRHARPLARAARRPAS